MSGDLLEWERERRRREDGVFCHGLCVGMALGAALISAVWWVMVLWFVR
jgi:hypothetical protein